MQSRYAAQIMRRQRVRFRVHPFLLGVLVVCLGQAHAEAAPGGVAPPETAPHSATTPGAVSPTPAKPARATADPAAKLLDQLAHARSSAEARAFEAQLQAVWTDQLSPTARLMTRRAEREIGSHRYADAVADLNDTLSLQPDSSELWRRLARAQAEAGDDDAAIRSLGGALSREPRNIFAWRDLSIMEELRKDDAAALRAWRKLLELDPKTDGAETRAHALDLKANGAPT